MNTKPLRSNKLDLQLDLNETAAIQSRRKIELSSSGAFLIEDVLEIKGSGTMTGESKLAPDAPLGKVVRGKESLRSCQAVSYLLPEQPRQYDF